DAFRTSRRSAPALAVLEQGPVHKRNGLLNRLHSVEQRSTIGQPVHEQACRRTSSAMVRSAYGSREAANGCLLVGTELAARPVPLADVAQVPRRRLQQAQWNENGRSCT